MRKLVVSELHFEDEAAPRDLLDPKLTNTFLIDGLAHLIRDAGHPVLVTAVRTDHPTPDSVHAHSGGFAADMWIADWATVGDEKIADLLTAIATNPDVRTVGLGGAAKTYCPQSLKAWGDLPGRWLFMDNDSDHVHFQVANADGVGPFSE